MPTLESTVNDAMRYRRTGGSGCFVHNQDAVDLLHFGLPALDAIEHATLKDLAQNCVGKPDEAGYRGFLSVMVIYNRLIDDNKLYDRAVNFAKALPPNLFRDMLGGMYIVIGCAKPRRRLPEAYTRWLQWICSVPELISDSGISRSIDQIKSHTDNTLKASDARQ